MQFPPGVRIALKGQSHNRKQVSPPGFAPPRTPHPQPAPVYCHVAAFGEMLQGKITKSHWPSLWKLNVPFRATSQETVANFKVPLSGVHSIRRGAGRSAGLSGQLNQTLWHSGVSVTLLLGGRKEIKTRIICHSTLCHQGKQGFATSLCLIGSRQAFLKRMADSISKHVFKLPIISVMETQEQRVTAMSRGPLEEFLTGGLL